MAYGQDAPQGCVPKSTLLGAQSIQNLAQKVGVTADIASRYPNNIGIGDPVCLDTSTGFIVSGWDFANDAGSLSQTNIYGIFAGCKIPYQTNNPNIQFPNAPGINRAWIANTTTTNNTPTPAYIIPSTYQGLFSVQTDSKGCSRLAIMKYGRFVFQTVDDAGQVVAISESGQSLGYLDCNTGGNGYAYGTAVDDANPVGACSFQIVGFDDSFSLGNTTTARTQIGLPYGNVLVRIAATQFATPTTTKN